MNGQVHTFTQKGGMSDCIKRLGKIQGDEVHIWEFFKKFGDLMCQIDECTGGWSCRTGCILGPRRKASRMRRTEPGKGIVWPQSFPVSWTVWGWPRLDDIQSRRQDAWSLGPVWYSWPSTASVSLKKAARGCRAKPVAWQAVVPITEEQNGSSSSPGAVTLSVSNNLNTDSSVIHVLGWVTVSFRVWLDILWISGYFAVMFVQLFSSDTGGSGWRLFLLSRYPAYPAPQVLGISDWIFVGKLGCIFDSYQIPDALRDRTCSICFVPVHQFVFLSQERFYFWSDISRFMLVTVTNFRGKNLFSIEFRAWYNSSAAAWTPDPSSKSISNVDSFRLR